MFRKFFAGLIIIIIIVSISAATVFATDFNGYEYGDTYPYLYEFDYRSIVTYEDFSYSDKVIKMIKEIEVTEEENELELSEAAIETVIETVIETETEEIDFKSLFRREEDFINSTENVLFTLTNPDFTSEEEKENIIYTELETFTVRGIAEETNILISLFKYDTILERFIPALNDEGINTWLIEVDSFGLFSSEDITLDAGEGIYKVVAYRNTEDNVLIYGEDIQVNYFTLNLIEKEDITEQIFDTIFDEWLDLLFSNNMLADEM